MDVTPLKFRTGSRVLSLSFRLFMRGRLSNGRRAVVHLLGQPLAFLPTNRNKPVTLVQSVDMEVARFVEGS